MAEQLYIIKYDLKDIPLCPVCGKKLRFISFSRGYAKHCNTICARKDIHTKEKYFDTIKKKQLAKNSIHDFSEINNENDRIILSMFCLSNGHFDGNKSKYENKWCQKHKDAVNYVKYRWKCPKDSIIENVYRIKYNLQVKPTCIVCGSPVRFISFSLGYAEVCSHSCSNKRTRTKNKYRETSLLKYGVEHHLQNKEIRNKIKQTYLRHISSTFFNDKITTFESKFEKYVKSLLLQLYSNVKQYYYDDRYANPRNNYHWQCDFYIPDIDLFIECQGFCSHGGHPYNKLDNNDALTLKN